MWGRRCIPPLILTFGFRLKWVVTVTLRQLYSSERTHCTLNRTLEGPQNLPGRFQKQKSLSCMGKWSSNLQDMFANIYWVIVSFVNIDWRVNFTWGRNWISNRIAIFLTDLDLFWTVCLIIMLLTICGFHINWRKEGRVFLTATNSVTFKCVPWKSVTCGSKEHVDTVCLPSYAVHCLPSCTEEKSNFLMICNWLKYSRRRSFA